MSLVTESALATEYSRPIATRVPSIDPAAPGHQLSLLLVEDDREDAILVEELIADANADIRVVWASSMADAERELGQARPDCVLLDLNLPDANGISALDRITKLDDQIPVVVLTGISDEHFGVSALASGAQDYLVKGRVDPDMLRRALLYAIERKRAELTAVALRSTEVTALENARLARGLLPTPLLLPNPGVDIEAQYQPSHQNALLGGDFYDVVQTPDRTVHVLVGDVAGHGPDAAAVGVALRIGWRALTFAGLLGNERMRQLERILRAERPVSSGIFATVLCVALAPDGLGCTVVRAGHPGMLLHGPETVDWLEPRAGAALGLNATEWPTTDVDLPAGHGLVLLTDGIFEGHSGIGNSRLGETGLLDIARTLAPLPGREFVRSLIDAVEECARGHGGISDDIAVVRVQRLAP